MGTKAKIQPKKKDQPRPPAPLPAGTESLLSYREIAQALNFSERFVKRMVSTGEYPAADLRISNEPRWLIETHNAWVRSRTGKGGKG